MNNQGYDDKKLIYKIGDYFIRNEKCNKLLLKIIFKFGYSINYNSPYEYLTNKDIIHVALKNTSDIATISNIINYYSFVRLDASDIESAIDSGYQITEESPIYIRSSTYFLSLYLKKFLNSNYIIRYSKLALIKKLALNEAKFRLNELINNHYKLDKLDDILKGDYLVSLYALIRCEQLNEQERSIKVTQIINSRKQYIYHDEIMFAVNLGYQFSSSTPDYVKKDSKAVHLALKLALKLNAQQKAEQITEIIDHADFVSVRDIKFAIRNGYRYSEKSPYYIINSYDIIHYALECTKNMKYDDKLNRINEIMSNIKGEINYKDLIYVLSSGYEISNNSKYKLCGCNSEIISDLLIKTKNPYIIDLAHSDIYDEDIIEAFNYGYQLTDKSSYVIRANPLAIHLELLKTRNLDDKEKKQEIKRIIDLAVGHILTRDIEYAFENNYTVSNETPKTLINNNYKMREYFYRVIDNDGFINKTDNLKNKYDALARKIGYEKIILIYDDFFKYTKFIEMYDVDDLYNILRYVYMSSEKSKNALKTILENDYIENVNNLYNLLNSNIGLNKMKLFKTICINYLKYKDLCDDFLNNKNLVRDSDVILLSRVLVDNSIVISDEISSVLQLRKWKELLYEKYEQVIDTNDGIAIKDIIFQMLCNKTYKEINYFISNIFNTDKIDRLLLSINNSDVKAGLLMYRAFMEYLESINQIQNIEDLQYIAKVLIDLSLSDDDSLNVIIRNFKDIDTKVKIFYGEEIREKVTDFKKLDTLNSSDVNITKQKYCVSDITIANECLNGRVVDYIELNGIPFLAFAHVLNAFGLGGKLSDFKQERLIGKSYICLSAFSDQYLKLVRSSSFDEEHVTLLFSDFSSNQLVSFSYKDLLSNGENNDLNITLELEPVFASINDIINATKTNCTGYNEYIMYRDGLYPNAILVRGIKPKQSEINAAAYLGVPLVKIHKSKYKKLKNNLLEKEISVTNREVKKADDLKDLKMILEQLQSLVQNFDNDINEIKKVI